jgi:outer membrane protein OmpA-like peptidoglycan-associated protein
MLWLPKVIVKGSAQAKAPTRTGKTGVAGLVILSSLWSPVGLGNVVGSDTQNFNPTTSGLDFVTVHSSETLEPGVINFGLFLNHAVNTLPYFDDGEQGRTKYSDSLLGADLNIGIGLLPGLDIGLSAPQVLNQRAESGGFHGQFSDNGNTEVRFNTKWRLWGTSQYGVAVVGSANINRIKNNPFVGEDAGPTTNLELVADTTIKNVALGLNLGHRWRKPGKAIADAAPIEPLGNQYIASIAASYLFASIDTKLIFEIFGSRPAEAESENSDRLASSSEALLGIKHDFTTALAGHFGAGTELNHGRASPDWRIYLGLNYAVGPTFSKPAPRRDPPPAGPTKDPFLGPPQAKEKIVIHDILFEFDSDSLVIGGTDDTLSRLVAYLNVKPVFTRLVIEGHTDSIGGNQYNDDLSRRRANTIKKWLVERYKLNPSLIETVGRGENLPIADNGNFQGRQLNRRVEFTIYRK